MGMSKTGLLLASTALAVLLAVVVAFVGIEDSAEASFPGKNGKIAFYSNQDGDAEIYKINPDGSGLKQVTHNTVPDFDPSWSPDGSKVAFWRHRRNDINEIFVKNTTTGQLVQLSDSNDSMSDTSPSWSPDGSQIVFVSDDLVNRSRDIWVMNADGSGRKRLTPANSLVEGTVVWSPDGTKIAFDDWGQPSDVWLMNSDGTNLQNLTNTSSEPLITERDPTWSPDGSKIAFMTRNPFDTPDIDIWVMNVDGSGKQNLTKTPFGALEVNPAWSPNGRKIAFIKGSADFFVPDIWVMNADGTSPRNITNSLEVADAAPDWQPLVQATP
jgi:Tol biopolymer transport system component